ncbi:MerR family DNA-binding protein [Aestuariicella hydrocarbonica]|uniref:MerR family DNA-binding protein n=1 Tax=Pseudomaricurvus hydrocarbonicus TaxID=1470433 RepID=A0A9E5MNF2_9GAMM|nr:MerR family DNA-binding protein [Aestuariicella hydrocarbonica]
MTSSTSDSVTKAIQRRYSRYILRQLAIIRVAQSLGLSLKEIREQLSTLPHNKAPSAAD